jgi:fluoroquinolone transport system permease protein
MRLITSLLHDIKYQYRHGFYFIYIIIVLFYFIIFEILPDAWRAHAVTAVLFLDPVVLGFFFIGGILLLEKGERVLDALFVSPLTVWEYVISKAVSLGILSAAAGLIIAASGLGRRANFALLVPVLLLGSVVYTFVGLAAGVRAKSVNQFMIITVPAEILLSAPPAILLFGVDSILLEIMPGSLLLRLLQHCADVRAADSPLLMLTGLIIWSVPALLLAISRMKWFLSKIGGSAYETDSKAA